MTASFVPIPNANVIEQDVFGELLVYDLERNIVRRLNQVAAAIWTKCDGHRDTMEIAHAVAIEMGNQVDEQVVLLALRQFSKAHLLAERVPVPARNAKVSRRELIKRIGIAALPLVTFMAVPTSAQAASCLQVGHNCSSNSQCCSGLCLPGTLGIGVCT
jgi:hypothetical protein